MIPFRERADVDGWEGGAGVVCIPPYGNQAAGREGDAG